MRNKYVLYGALFIFIVLFILVRIPLYTHFFVPEFDPDSFDYFNYSYLINQHAFHQIGQLPIDLPPLYPAFVSLVSLFTSNIAGIIYLQLIIYLIACIVLLFELSYWGALCFLFGTAGLLLYSVNSYTITYESAIITESLYISSLILLTAAVFRAVRNPSNINVALLSVAIIIPSAIRPTGFSLYFLPIVFAIYFYKKGGAAKLVSFIMPLLLLCIIWASWNYCISGTFFPGNYKRVLTCCHVKINPAYLEPVYENLRIKNGVVVESHYDSSGFKSRVHDYLHQVSQKVPNFYSSLMPTRIRRFYINNLPSLPQLSYMYNGDMLVPPAIKKYTYRNYLDMPQKNEVNSMLQQLSFENCKHNPCILLYSVFNKLENILIRNKISYLLVIFSLVLGVVLSFTSFINSKKFIAFFIPVLMFFSSVIIGATFGGFQYRYGHVILFIVYLLPCLYVMLLTGLSGNHDFLKK